jgi:hypothetical protein
MGVAGKKTSLRSKKNKRTQPQPMPTVGFVKTCCNCGSTSKSISRIFSETAWTVLVLWEEISSNAVKKPLCQECYEELRDILIERTEEIEATLAQSDQTEKIKRHVSGLAS